MVDNRLTKLPWVIVRAHDEVHEVEWASPFYVFMIRAMVLMC